MEPTALIVGGMFGLSLYILRLWLKDNVKEPTCAERVKTIKALLDKEKEVREVKEAVIEKKLDELKDTFSTKVDEQKKQSDILIKLMRELVTEVKNGGRKPLDTR